MICGRLLTSKSQNFDVLSTFCGRKYVRLGRNPKHWGCPLVVRYWADLQSVHGLHCYGNITQTQNVSEYMLVLAVCLVLSLSSLTYYVAALCNRAGHIYFHPVVSSLFFFSSPSLTGRRLDVYHTSTHGVALV